MTPGSHNQWFLLVAPDPKLHALWLEAWQGALSLRAWGQVCLLPPWLWFPLLLVHLNGGRTLLSGVRKHPPLLSFQAQAYVQPQICAGFWSLFPGRLGWKQRPVQVRRRLSSRVPRANRTESS